MKAKREEAEGQGHGLNQNHNHHTINEFNFDFTLTLFLIWDNSDLCQRLLGTESFTSLHIVDAIFILSSLSLLFLSTSSTYHFLLVHRSPQSGSNAPSFLAYASRGRGTGKRKKKQETNTNDDDNSIIVIIIIIITISSKQKYPVITRQTN